jgi:hypothetical protein
LSKASLISRLTAALLTVLSGCTDMGADPPATPGTTTSTQSGISFRAQVQPIFSRYGCTGCHGGTSGLKVGSVADLLKGGLHGGAIVTGKADSSILIKKISASPPFGDRMPQGGPFLPDTTVQVLKDWINQGAQNN